MKWTSVKYEIVEVWERQKKEEKKVSYKADKNQQPRMKPPKRL